MIKLKIEGMNCQHCVNTVSDALAGVPGVTLVLSVDLDSASARIEGDADPQALISAVQGAGYQATVAA